MPGSGEFTVDVEELGSLSTRLDRCTESMKHAGSDLRSASVGDLGNGQIDKAGAQFKSSWEYGISQIAEITDAIRQGLQVTARAYNDTDSAISQAFAKGHQGGGSSGKDAQASPFG
ncbi:WXG100 family type VII secretion target [Streptomyces sp. NPDC048644]|uniref:WXG100 family type VII secretion target n=1 Tax=Streptomyces sp. NPDC048644 TaxID=3365582 RepID=UPI003714FBB8